MTYRTGGENKDRPYNNDPTVCQKSLGIIAPQQLSKWLNSAPKKNWWSRKQ